MIIYTIQEDQHGQLWIAGEHGICRLSQLPPSKLPIQPRCYDDSSGVHKVSNFVMPRGGIDRAIYYLVDSIFFTRNN